VASAGKRPTWYLFYTFPVAISLVNVAFICWAFRDTLLVKRRTMPTEGTTPVEQTATDWPPQQQVSRSKDAVALIKSTLRRPSVWLLSLFYFFYIGSQITLNGWVVEYLVEERGGELSSMGYVPAGFNGGCLLGRLLLAEPTHRLGERRMVFSYCCIAVALQIVFWL
jgi:fucose permease